MKKWALIIPLLVTPLWSYGGPPEIITKLIKQEVSLFSFGLYRLDSSVKRLVRDDWFGSANFSYNTGTITIRAFSHQIKCKDESDCLNIIKVKLAEFVPMMCYRNPENKSANCDIDLLSGYFSPVGYTISNFHNGRDSETAALDVSRHVELHFSLFRTGAGDFSCTQKLLSNEVFCRKH